MELTERFEWHGRKIAWGRAGAGPAVVFCHGTPFSSVLWQPFAEALSRNFTVYLWDMPGYGQSSKHADHPVDFGAQADAFAALLAHWGLDRPHVIAHDFGGAVSLRTHLILGVDYASLMLVDVVAIPPSGSPFFKFVQDHPDVLPRLPAYIHTAIVRAYVQGASHRGLRDDDLDALVQPWTGEEGQPAFYRQIAHYDERFLEENEEQLGRISIPVRILWGTSDAWIPTDIARRLHGLIPTAELSLIDAAGHLVHHDAPVPFMDEIRAWLTLRTRARSGL
ncbi:MULTISPECIES: alpha/beta hydrolase [unclassified Nonomuraea]|uniref:alpha/beta fold hydrolase n=1 Tax=unclassified Nonomuraea TaxID=2593643 RepID=UPI0033CB622F